MLDMVTRDILQKDTLYIVKRISFLHESYKKFRKIPIDRHITFFFEKKEDDFYTSLEMLFDVTVKSLHNSGLITTEDCEFLLYYWEKSRRPLTTKRSPKILVLGIFQ